jgi:hypothetical protein
MKKMRIVIVALILSLGCLEQKKSWDADESLEIARKFVLNSPTYEFDGENLRHVDTVGLDCPSCWQFIFEFTSRHAGYGDRSEKTMAQVITAHTAIVSVENGTVTYAVLDERWDMTNQEMIEQ